jgi:RHS repeat-associated protein
MVARGDAMRFGLAWGAVVRRLPVFAGVMTIAIGAAALVQTGRPQAQTTPPAGAAMPALPSVKILKGTPISPTAAQTWYAAQSGEQAHTDGLCRDYAAKTDICDANAHAYRAPEIKELARALKYDPNLIYEYLRNTVDTEFLFGSHKGALGVIIDHSGTAFDQAELMAELLSESGITARIKYGTISLSGTEFQAWTGIIDARAACDFLATGGIPLVVNGNTPSACSSLSGNAATVVMAHAWVEADIPSAFGGGARQFDPAYKPYLHKTGIANLKAALGVSGTSEALNAATNNGTIVGDSVSGLTAGALESKLTSYSRSLISYINDPANNLQGADLGDVIGGREILPGERPAGGWGVATLSYATATATWESGVPDVYRARLNLLSQRTYQNAQNQTVTETFVSANFFADEIYGRRLQIGPDADPAAGWATAAAGSWAPVLSWDGVVLQTGAALPAADNLLIKLNIKALHPFAAKASSTAASGSYGDSSVDKVLDFLHPATIVSGWGYTSEALVAKWEREQAHDMEGPVTFFAPTAVEATPMTNNSGDLIRARAAATWLGQFSRSTEIHAEIAQARAVMLHTVGVVSADENAALSPPEPGATVSTDTIGYMVYDETTVVDLESSFGLVTRASDTGAAKRRKAAVHAIAATAATLEGSVLAQLTDTPDASSTASRFAWGNAPEESANTGSRGANRYSSTTAAASAFGASTYEGGTGPISASGYLPAVPQSAVDWMRYRLATTVQSYAAADFDVIASNESWLGPGHRAGSEYPAWTVTLNTGGQNWGVSAQEASCIAQRATFASGTTEPGTTVASGSCDIGAPGSGGGWTQWFNVVEGLEQDPGATTTITGYQRFTSLQRGGALVATRYERDSNGARVNDDPAEIAHVLTRVGVPIKGGGGPSVTQAAQFNPSTAAQSLKDRFVDRSSGAGVDIGSGRAGFRSQVLEAKGQGEFPYRLERTVGFSDGSFKGGAADQLQVDGGRTCASIDNLQGCAEVSSSGFEAMGQSRAEAAAPTVAAFVAMQEIWTADPSAAREVAGLLVAKWWSDRLLFNVVSIFQGTQAEQFVRSLKDISTAEGDSTAKLFIAAGGGADKVVLKGDRTVVRPNLIRTVTDPAQKQTESIDRVWKYDDVSLRMDGAQADRKSFEFWSSAAYAPTTETRTRGWRLKKWRFPQGVDLTPHYADVTGQPAPTADRIDSSLGYSITLLSGSYVKDTNYLGWTASGAVSSLDATDNSGGKTRVELRAPTKRSPTQRPDQYYRVQRVIYPDGFPATGSPKAGLEYAFDSLGRIKTAKDAEAIQLGVRGAHTFYIAEGFRSERTDPAGGEYAVESLFGGRVSRHTELLSVKSNGERVTRRFMTLSDGRGRPLVRVFPLGDQSCFTYDERDNPIEYRKVARGGADNADLLQVIANGCNQNNRPTIVTKATWSTAYNKPTQVTEFFGTDRQRVTDITYEQPLLLWQFGGNGEGEVKKVQLAAPTTGGSRPEWNFTYWGNGRPKLVTDPTGVMAYSEYDSSGYLTLTRRGSTTSGLYTTFCNDADGNVTCTWNARGEALTKVTREFDAMGRVTRETYRDGGYTQFSYDAVGRVVQTTKHLVSGTTDTAQVWQTGYTPTGQVAWTRDPSNDVALIAYDAMDRKVRVTNGEGEITQFDYDRAGRLTSEVRGVDTGYPQTFAAYDYYADDQQLKITDGRGNSTEFWFDDFGRPYRTWYGDPTLAATAYEEVTAYDNASNPVKVRLRNPAAVPTGGAPWWISSTYDLLGRKLSETGLWSDNTAAAAKGAQYMRDASFTYDAAGRMLTAVTDQQTRTYAYDYDNGGRVQSHAWSQGGTFTYGYDAADNLTSMVYPDARAAGYEYDGLNRTTAARLYATSGGTQLGSAVIAYDTLGRRSQVTFGDNSTQAYTWQLDDDLEKSSHVFPGGTSGNVDFTYGYDKAGRQTAETISNAAYQYDPPVTTASYGAATGVNTYPTYQPVSGGSTATVTWYDDGALKADGTYKFFYDQKRNLTRVEAAAASTNNEVNRHDALGERFWAERNTTAASGAATLMLSAGLRPEIVAERTYSRTNSTYDAATTWTDYVLGPAPDERLIWIDTSGTVRYPHTDKRTSTIALANTGTAETKFKYGPFGESSDATGGYAWRYTGQKLDSWTGLYFYKAREYSPAWGRFIQPDPAMFVDGPNLYAYVGSDPLNQTDALGLQSCGKTGENCPLSATKGSEPDGQSIRVDLRSNEARGKVLEVTGTLLSLAPHPYTKAAGAVVVGAGRAISGTAVPVTQPKGPTVDIYVVPGPGTKSGREYVGRAGGDRRRMRDHRDGRDRSQATVVRTVPAKEGPVAEQQVMNERGGVGSLDNARNEIAPCRWESCGVKPPPKGKPKDG